MRYGWLLEGFNRDVDAQEAGEFLESLQEKYNDNVTAEEILAAARSTYSPIHKMFTWNENDAAEKQRRTEARRLATNLVVVKNKKKTLTRAFVFVRHPGHKRNVYVSLKTAMGTPELREQTIEAGIRSLNKRLSSWQNHFGHMAAFRPIAKSVDRLRDKLMAEYMAALS